MWELLFSLLSFQERDLSVAFCLVAFTYTLVGVLFFISFPREKDCIQQVIYPTKSCAWLYLEMYRFTKIYPYKLCALVVDAP